MGHVLDRLPAYALGVLRLDEAAEVSTHLASCPECGREDRALSEAVAGVADALKPAQPRPMVRARLLAAMRQGGRLARFVEQVVGLFDVTADKARALLDELDEPAAWEDEMGLKLIHLSGGPKVRGADVGFVRFPAGVKWPRHRHLGDERMLILEGGLRDDGGREYGPGDLIVMGSGTEHAFDVFPDKPLLTALVLYEGIEMLGAPEFP